MKDVASRTLILVAALLIPACSKDHDSDPVSTSSPPPGGGGAIPAAPVATATPGDTQVELTWPAVAGATAYHIESGTDAGGPYGWVERNFTGTTFVDDTLQNGTTYYYRVYSTNAAGDSPPSAEVNATPAGGAQPAGTLQFTSTTYTASETAGSAVLLVSRTGGSNGTVTASFSTSPGTALGGVDYATTSGTLTWPAGVTTDQQIVISISNRPGLQGDRFFTVTLSAPTGGAALGAPSSATVTISD
jgi:hypothetical protein